jgi:uncharacterized protein (DUF433 family)
MALDLPTDKICRLYRNGATISEIANRFGCSYTAIRNRLVQRDVELRMGGGKSYNLPVSEIIYRYRQGESILALAEAYEVSRPVIRSRLESAAVELRSASEANRKRMESMSAEERVKLTKAANAARRNVSQNREREISRNQALAKQRSLEKVGKGEWSVAAFLVRQGYTPILQKAILTYNVDVAVGSVAVEVHNMPSNPHAPSGPHERIVKILERGWHVFYIKIDATGLQRGGLDKLLSFLQTTRSNPSMRRQYRMIRGDGSGLTVGKSESNQLTLVGSTDHGLDRLRVDAN